VGVAYGRNAGLLTRYQSRESAGTSLQLLTCEGGVDINCLHGGERPGREGIAQSAGSTRQVGAEAAARQEEKGIAPIGADAIRRQDPHQRPKKTKKSSAPLFHAATKRVRGDLYNIYYVFVAAFREAAEKLKAGNRNAVFPIGSFPPGLPFVSG